MPDNYSMPDVSLGQTVYWHMDCDETMQPSMALVTSVGDHGITLAVIVPGSYNIQPIAGVPHLTDPRVAKLLDVSAGCWQHIAEWEANQSKGKSKRSEPKSVKGSSEALKL